MLLKKHVLAVFLLGVVVMSGFAPALSTASDISNNAVAPLVVQFGDTVEEMVAITELKTNFPEAIVVDFRSQSQILSFAGPIIYVGHSSEEGIRYHGRTVPWEFLANLIRNSASDAHYILGCESSKVTELTLQTGKRVFSFEQKVDAILGSHVVSFLIARYLSFSNPFIFLLRGFNRLSLIENNIQNPMFLYMSEIEKRGHAAAFLLIIGLALMTATASVSSSLLRKAISLVVGLAATSYIDAISTTMIEAYSNYDTSTMISVVGNIFKLLFDAVYIAAHMAPWYLSAAMMAAAATDVAANTLGAAVKAALIFTVLGVSGGYQIYWANRDREDPNPYFMA